jgi:hypothetical protein
MSPTRAASSARPRARAVRWTLVGRLLALAYLGLASTNCSVSTTAPRSAEQLELTRNRERWTSAAIHDYEFDYQLLCFCSPDATEPVHITVRQDAIASVVRKRDGLPAVTKYGGWPHVGELFADIQSRLDQHVDRLTVDYDPALGYPRSIVVDVAAMSADDEYSHTAGNLRPLP